MKNKKSTKFLAGFLGAIAVAVLAFLVFQNGVTKFFSDLALFNQNEVVVVTHDSAVFPQELLDEFKAETGLTVTQLKAGDVGSMVNKLVLTKDTPIGDMVYGIDNTFATVATKNQILELAPGDNKAEAALLTPINFGDVCINYDLAWFAKNEIIPPATIADLTKPDYQGLTVLTNPTTSSPGLAFLATTVSTFGEQGWQQYWRALKSNNVKIASGWEDAYFTEFSGSSGKGAYPIVLSYTSSPAFEIREDGKSQTASMRDGCFRQYESAGILSGAKNPTGAAKFIAFMQEIRFQESLPDANYVYPINGDARIPDAWAEFAPAARSTVGADLDIELNRQSWFTSWNQIFSAN